MKQYEAVIKVMEKNRGFASLSYLNENVFKVPNVTWGTKTPFASIRRIVQDERFFFKIKPGLWALKTYRNKLPNEVAALIEGERSPEEEKESTHSYYQGMIVEVGNLKGYQTCVPPQDNNKGFLNRPLKEIATLDSIHQFTYQEIVQRVKSIDVFWFNERDLPSHVFEIEYSTSFKNSLLKFLELQDFRVNMFIATHDRRVNEFGSIIDFSAFKPIRERVKVLTFEKIAQWHTKTHELALAEQMGE